MEINQDAKMIVDWLEEKKTGHARRLYRVYTQNEYLEKKIKRAIKKVCEMCDLNHEETIQKLEA